MSATLQATPLRDFHVRHGGRLVDFAGWEMPVQYRSILEEHRAVRGAAGLFDVSHMGEFEVSGPGSGRFLNGMVTNDVAKLHPGRVLYTPMCQPDGGVVDDLLIYMRGPEDFFLCVNAGNIAKDLNWLQEHVGDSAVSIRDRSTNFALLALQGPQAAAILQPLCGIDLGLIRYYHFGEGTVAGVKCMISRTGYTGEDGFELYHPAASAPALAEALFAAGQTRGLALAGLGARDSLRLESGYPLYGHELSATISPLAAGIGWTVKLDKGADFVGAAALRAEKQNGSPRRVAFFRTSGRRIVRAGAQLFTATGAAAGSVLSGTLSPILNAPIGSAWLESSLLSGPLHADFSGQPEPITLVQPPFVPLPPKP